MTSALRGVRGVSSSIPLDQSSGTSGGRGFRRVYEYKRGIGVPSSRNAPPPHGARPSLGLKTVKSPNIRGGSPFALDPR